MMQKWRDTIDLRQLGEDLWVPGIQLATGRYFHYIPQTQTFWRWNKDTQAWDDVSGTIGAILAAGTITPVTVVTR